MLSVIQCPNRPLIALLFVLAFSSSLFAGKEFLAGPKEQVAPDELLVGLRPGADLKSLVAALAPHAVAGIVSSRRNTYLLRVPTGTRAAVSRLLAAHPL